MSHRSVFGTYFMIEEALVVASLLADGGFDVSVDNYGHATINPMIIPTLGGIRLSLPAAQLTDARIYLMEMVQSSQARLEQEFNERLPATMPERVRWRAWVMAVISLPALVLAIGLALIWIRRRRKLNSITEDILEKASPS